MSFPIESMSNFPKTSQNNLEEIDTIPKVENLIFAQGKSVLIKTSFPQENGVAKCFILVERPSRISYEEALHDAIALGGEMNEEQLRDFEIGYNISNRPYVFKNPEDIEEWFQYREEISGWSTEEKARIAMFLDLEQ